jgi:hypothetical protein
MSIFFLKYPFLWGLFILFDRIRHVFSIPVKYSAIYLRDFLTVKVVLIPFVIIFLI